MSKKSAVVLVLLAALVAGCGGGDGDADKPGNAGTGNSTPSEAPKTADPADVAIAEASVLVLSDFESGWESQAAEEEDDDDVASKRRIAECSGVTYDDLYGNGLASAESDTFVSEGDDEISSSVTVASDEQVAQKAFVTFTSAKYRECALKEVKAAIEEGIKEDEDDYKLGDVTLNEISFDSFGDESTAFRVSVELESDGISVEINLDYVLVRVGRAATAVEAQATFSPFDSGELAGFVKTATDRLTEQLGAAS